MKTTFSTITLLATLTVCCANDAHAKPQELFEFEGRFNCNEGKQIFSYVFLPAAKIVIRLHYNCEGAPVSISHGDYAMTNAIDLVIRWKSGSLERGRFSKCRKKYCVHRDANPSKTEDVATGCWQCVKDPKRMQLVHAYVRARNQASLGRQLQRFASNGAQFTPIENWLETRLSIN